MGSICPSIQRQEFRQSNRNSCLSDIIPDCPGPEDASSEDSSPCTLPKQEQLIRFYEKQGQLQEAPVAIGPLVRSKSLAFSNSMNLRTLDSTSLRLKEELLSTNPSSVKSQNLAAVLSLPDFMDSSDVERVFRNIFELSVDYCPLLALEHFAGDCLRERELSNYQNILRSQKENFVQKMKRMHRSYKIPREEFIDFLNTHDFILSTAKLREHILKEYIVIH